MFKFECGDEVQDVITGFKGIVRSCTKYLTGCNVYGIQSSKLNKEGLLPKWEHFDEGQLKLIKSKKIQFNIENVSDIKSKKESSPPGGPLSADQFPVQR